MFSDSFYISIKQYRDLITIKPHRLILDSNLQG